MTLEQYVREAASILAPAVKEAEDKASRDVFGTIALDSSGNPTVMLDGAEAYTPCTAMVSVHQGDRVMAHVVNHKLVVFANITAPVTDDEKALVAIDRADAATEAADKAGKAAASAQEDATAAKADAATAKASAASAVSDAQAAKSAATQAQTDASSAAQSAQSAQADAQAASTSAQQAQADASSASTSAGQAAASASQAAESASQAQADATTASNAATQAQGSASQAAGSATSAQQQAQAAKAAADGAVSDAAEAKTAAGEARTAANEAKADAKTAKDNAAQAVSDAATAKQAATDATTTANGAVTALATVQGVVDQLETDVDELQVHVAMMDAYSDGHGGTVPAGLHVVPTGSGYFLVIANDGTYVYDAQSVLVTKFGESIDFSSTRPQRIGNENAYVEYYDSDNDGIPDSIRIKADSIDLGGTSVADKLSTQGYTVEIAATATDTASGAVTLTATVRKDGTALAAAEVLRVGCVKWYRADTGARVGVGLTLSATSGVRYLARLEG